MAFVLRGDGVVVKPGDRGEFYGSKLGIKVTDLEGNRISFGRALGRNLAKIISVLTFYIGYIMAAFTAKKQALQDMIAGTLVVKKGSTTPMASADVPM